MFVSNGYNPSPPATPGALTTCTLAVAAPKCAMATEAVLAQALASKSAAVLCANQCIFCLVVRLAFLVWPMYTNRC